MNKKTTNRASNVERHNQVRAERTLLPPCAVGMLRSLRTAAVALALRPSTSDRTSRSGAARARHSYPTISPTACNCK